MFVTSDEKHNREERCDRQKSKKPPSLRKTAGRYKRNFAQAVQRAIPRPPALRSSGFLPFACACLAELAGVHAKARAERVALWGKSCATCHRQAHATVPNHIQWLLKHVVCISV